MFRNSALYLLAIGSILYSSCGGKSPQETKAEPIAALGVTQNLPAGSAAAKYHIDNIETATVVPGQPVRIPVTHDFQINGWAIDAPNETTASTVDVVVDGTPYASQYGVARTDVADYFKKPEYKNSGFQLIVPAGRLQRGTHRVSIRVVGNDGKSYATSPDVTVIVE
jgi:hypothetical protein